MQQTNPYKVLVLDRHGYIRAHPMWANNPRIGGQRENVFKPQYLTNGPGVRPYIEAKTETKWIWKEWECPRGEIYLSPQEKEFAEPFHPAVILEPNNKPKASPNKDWGRARWQTLADMLRREGIEAFQLGTDGTQRLRGVRFIYTGTFRDACAVMANAKACVLPDGGLHHAAAALGIPAIVIMGGYISPKQTGYASHVNLFTGGNPCGMRIPCDHCGRAMSEITPILVMGELKKLLDA